MTEKKIEQMMKSLDLTREEAIEMLMEDEAVDKMSMKEVTSDLTAEQKKAVKAVTKATSDKPKAKAKRERKVDLDKLEILSVCDDALCDLVDNVCERKTETELNFEYKGVKYTLKLIKHRPPKASKQTPFFLTEKEQMFYRPGRKKVLTTPYPYVIIRQKKGERQ